MKHSDINWAHFVKDGTALVGKKYNFGEEVNLADRNPDNIKAIDCSELVEWLYAGLTLVGGPPAGIAMPDGSYNQAKLCQHVSKDGLLIGDLGFKWFPDTHSIHHVGVHIGGGNILEAKGRDYGVVITPIEKYMATSHFAFWGRHPKIQDA